MTNEKLVTGDWARGPAGTNEVQWTLPGIWAYDKDAPMLGLSWELPDSETIVFRIRKGVYFHNKPPAMGREMTAEDVAYSIWRKNLDPQSIFYTRTEADRIRSVQAVDKWTVVVKVPPILQGSYIQGIYAETWIFPKELGEKGVTTAWQDVIGTGPFIVSDYVPVSAISFKKNPTYWLADPVRPQNKLPYVDNFRILIIQDPSTRISALRTGKIDAYRGLAWDEGESVIKSNPELQYARYLLHTAPIIYMRLDKAGLPYQDIKVRRALNMSVDRDTIIKGYYNGNAEKFAQPVMPTGELADIFVPLSEQSKENQELYQYLPDKAKQLLKEAGYPNGFKAKVVCEAAQVDILSIVKEQWAKIGVIIDLDVKESGTYQSIQRGGGWEDMLMAYETGIYYTVPLGFLKEYYPTYNRGNAYDQYIEDFYREKMLPYRGPIADKILRKNLKELVPYLVSVAFRVELPTPYLYGIWQPWVGGYHGEYSTGRGWWNDFPMYVWVDPDIKFQYTGKR
ncbi:MAG: ABC transporter substrate-binding protein [Dehalococcoidia bacterium]|nr:ABC transporter substrate-binding protein [Dehalococcoidia bacterium]